MIARRDFLSISGCGWMNWSLGSLMATQAPSFRSTVNLVMLDVLVTDDAGRPVPGLEKSNFKIKEKNKLMTVDRVTTRATNLSVGIVLDYSRSMQTSMAKVVQAVEKLRTRLAPEDEAFVLVFNERVSTIVPATLLAKATPWSTPLYKVRPDGQTALFDAISQGSDLLKNAVHERRAMVVLSDGKDTASKATRGEASKRLLESNTLFYSVGLFEQHDIESDGKTLSSFADDTGGRAIFEPSVDKLASEFDGILAELRARYVLGFLTSESTKADGETRRVRVYATDANGRSLHVRTRESFFIAGAPKMSELK